MEYFGFNIYATGLNPEAESFADDIYNAGCSDAVVAFQNSQIIFYFNREAATIEEAIESAVKDVLKSGAQTLHIKMEEESGQMEYQALAESILLKLSPDLGFLKALDAIHYYTDATDEELRRDNITREDALTLARELREKLDPCEARELRWSCN